MKRRKNFRRKPKEKKMNGLQVDVYNNNVDGALRKLKKIIKNSNIMMDLKEKQYYIKPSEKRRQRINKVKSRMKYQKLKDNSTKKH